MKVETSIETLDGETFMLRESAHLTLRFVAMGAGIALYDSPRSVEWSSSSMSITCPSLGSRPSRLREDLTEVEERMPEPPRLNPALCAPAGPPRFAI